MMGVGKTIPAKQLAIAMSNDPDTTIRDNENALARSSGVPQPTIHRILTGETSEPRRSTMQPLATYYGVDVELFFVDDPKRLIDAIHGKAITLNEKEKSEIEMLFSRLTAPRKRLVLALARELAFTPVELKKRR